MAESTNGDAKNAGSSFNKPDMSGIVNMYKKNLEIIFLMNKISLDVCKSVGELQSTFIQQMITDSCAACTNTKPTDAMYKFADLARNNMVKVVNNGKQISEMLTATGNEVGKTLTNQFKENIEVIKKNYR